eukprot:6208256-Pleurochrysis_carterae.AAC.1
MAASLSLANLAEQRRLVRGGGHFTYRPRRPAECAGGDLALPNTLRDVLPAAASVEREIMLLGAGGEGTMRNAVNLVLNLRSMGLYHMLIMAPEKKVCDRLWEVSSFRSAAAWTCAMNAPSLSCIVDDSNIPYADILHIMSSRASRKELCTLGAACSSF